MVLSQSLINMFTLDKARDKGLWYITGQTLLQADTGSLKLPLGVIIQPDMKTHNSTIPKPVFLHLVHKVIKKDLIK